MEVNIMGDLISFGIAVISGLIVGLVFDFYRVFRYYSNPNKFLSYIEDLLFWILIGAIFFVVLVKVTDGILRGFIFIGFFLGGLVYMLMLSKYVFSLIKLIFKLILDLISEIIKILSYPFKKSIVFAKKRVGKVFLIPKYLLKEMNRYRKIISRKK